MIDMLVLRCDFTENFTALTSHSGLNAIDTFVASLGVPCEVSVNRDGSIERARHAWDNIPSSYELVFKSSSASH